MVNRDLQVVFDSCLNDELDVLVNSCSYVSMGSQVVGTWNLPENDRSSLLRFGVPIFDFDGDRSSVQLMGDVQVASFPEINERDVIAYSLGTFWRRRIGASVETGVVVGVPDDSEPDLSYINNSVAAFIEIAWRWGCARRALLAIEDYEQLYECLAKFQEFVHVLDPVVKDDPRFSWWNGVIEGW